MTIRFFRTTVGGLLVACLLSGLVSWAGQDRRAVVYDLGMELERLSTSLAQESFDHFKGWNGEISDQEQAVLFKSEAFAASCRLFLKLTEARSGYYRDDFLRTNIYNAFTYLVGSFSDVEEEMRKSGVMPYALSDCRKLLNRMEREFNQWPAADNLAFLDQKYVKGDNDTVYLIERTSVGNYARLPFKNLESLWRYNYDRNGGKDPWKYLVEVAGNTLDKMRKGRMIDLSFEGRMIIEQSSRRDRPVYLIQGGKKRGLTRPDLVNRYGGWSKVFEVPREVIDSYPDGEPVL